MVSLYKITYCTMVGKCPLIPNNRKFVINRYKFCGLHCTNVIVNVIDTHVQYMSCMKTNCFSRKARACWTKPLCRAGVERCSLAAGGKWGRSTSILRSSQELEIPWNVKLHVYNIYMYMYIHCTGMFLKIHVHLHVQQNNCLQYCASKYTPYTLCIIGQITAP